MFRRALAVAIASAAILAPVATCNATADAADVVPVTWQDEWEGTPREAVWECLVDLGYRGVLGDRAERLYPTRADLEACQG